MKIPSKIPQFFRPVDYVGQAMHLVAATGLAIGVGIWAGPMVLAGSAAAAIALSAVGGKVMEMMMGKVFKKREIPTHNLENIINNFTDKAGLDHKPTLFDFEIDKKAVKKQSDSLQTPAQLKRIFNAAAFGLQKYHVIISEPLLQALQPKETEAVVAHEFTHLGAGHLFMKTATGILQTTTMFAAMVGFGHAVVAEGWLISMLSFGGTIAVAYVGQKIMPPKEERYARD